MIKKLFSEIRVVNFMASNHPTSVTNSQNQTQFERDTLAVENNIQTSFETQDFTTLRNVSEIFSRTATMIRSTVLISNDAARVETVIRQLRIICNLQRSIKNRAENILIPRNAEQQNALYNLRESVRRGVTNTEIRIELSNEDLRHIRSRLDRLPFVNRPALTTRTHTVPTGGIAPRRPLHENREALYLHPTQFPSISAIQPTPFIQNQEEFSDHELGVRVIALSSEGANTIIINKMSRDTASKTKRVLDILENSADLTVLEKGIEDAQHFVGWQRSIKSHVEGKLTLIQRENSSRNENEIRKNELQAALENVNSRIISATTAIETYIQKARDLRHRSEIVSQPAVSTDPVQFITTDLPHNKITSVEVMERIGRLSINTDNATFEKFSMDIGDEVARIARNLYNSTNPDKRRKALEGMKIFISAHQLMEDVALEKFRVMEAKNSNSRNELNSLKALLKSMIERREAMVKTKKNQTLRSLRHRIFDAFAQRFGDTKKADFESILEKLTVTEEHREKSINISIHTNSLSIRENALLDRLDEIFGKVYMGNLLIDIKNSQMSEQYVKDFEEKVGQVNNPETPRRPIDSLLEFIKRKFDSKTALDFKDILEKGPKALAEGYMELSGQQKRTLNTLERAFSGDQITKILKAYFEGALNTQDVDNLKKSFKEFPSTTLTDLSQANRRTNVIQS